MRVGDVFFTKVELKPPGPQVLLFLVSFLAFMTAAGVNIKLSKVSPVTGGVQVCCRPSSIIPTESKNI